MFCPTYKQQLCELKRLHNKTLLVLQWIEKPSCGSELVFLDLYPQSPAAKQKQRQESFFSLLPDTSRGGCAQVGRSMRASVSCAVSEARDVSLAATPRNKTPH